MDRRRVHLGWLLGWVLLAAPGAADTLSVTHAAAMGGTSWGMQVFHDNTTSAFVQDDTPTGEKSYRATFLLEVGTVTVPSHLNFRQALLRGIGSCPGSPSVAVLQLWLYQTASGTVSNLQVYGKGNLCGDQSASRIQVANNQPYRVCLEYQTGSGGTGFVALAVTDAAAACPPSGDAAWKKVSFSNHLTSLELIRLGTPAANAFGAGETVTLYFDEYVSEGEDGAGVPMSFADGFEWGDVSGWGAPASGCATPMSPPAAITGGR